MALELKKKSLVLVILVLALSFGTPINGQGPELVVSPVSASVEYGSSIIMSCVVTADSDPTPTISWNLNNNPVTSGSPSDFTITLTTISEGGFTFIQSTLEVCSIEGRETGQYSCTATNSVGSVSDTWNIDITADLIIVPESRPIDYGTTVYMACVAYGFPLPTITFNKDGAVVDDTNSSLVTVVNEEISSNGFTFIQSTIEVCDTKLSDIGQYSCSATNDIGTPNIRAWNLGFNTNPLPAELVIVPNGPTQYIDYGSTVLMPCVGYGYPLPTLSFMKDGVPVDMTSDRVSIHETEIVENGLNLTQSVLKICSSGIDDIGVYACIASNALGNDTRSWEVMFREVPVPPDLVIVPYNTQAVEYGDTVYMTCVVYGFPLPTLTFNKDGAIVDDANLNLVTVVNEEISSNGFRFAQSTIEICGTKLSDVGVYACIASNALGNDTRSWEVMFTEVPVPPELVVVPYNTQAVEYGDTVYMTCVAYGFPLPTITFTKDGAIVDDANLNLVTVVNEEISSSGFRFAQSTIEICGTKLSNVGVYACIASNTLGNDTRSWDVMFREVPVPPELVVVPYSTQAVEYGSTVMMACVSHGYPQTEMNFAKNGVPIDSLMSDRVNTTVTVIGIGGLLFTQAMLELCSLEVDDIGEYSCTASNALGSHSQSWNVTFTEDPLPPLLVITPLSNVSVDYGSTAIFTCVARGIPPPEITWKEGDTELRNTTSTSSLLTIYSKTIIENGTELVQSKLEMCAVTEENSGVYSCTAENPLGVQSFEWQMEVNIATQEPITTPTDVENTSESITTPTDVETTSGTTDVINVGTNAEQQQQVYVIGGALGGAVILCLLLVLILSLVVFSKWRRRGITRLGQRTIPVKHMYAVTQPLPNTPFEQSLKRLTAENGKDTFDSIQHSAGDDEEIYEPLDDMVPNIYDNDANHASTSFTKTESKEKPSTKSGTKPVASNQNEYMKITHSADPSKDTYAQPNKIEKIPPPDYATPTRVINNSKTTTPNPIGAEDEDNYYVIESNGPGTSPPQEEQALYDNADSADMSTVLTNRDAMMQQDDYEVMTGGVEPSNSEVGDKTYDVCSDSNDVVLMRPSK